MPFTQTVEVISCNCHLPLACPCGCHRSFSIHGGTLWKISWWCPQPTHSLRHACSAASCGQRWRTRWVVQGKTGINKSWIPQARNDQREQREACLKTHEFWLQWKPYKWYKYNIDTKYKRYIYIKVRKANFSGWRIVDIFYAIDAFEVELMWQISALRVIKLALYRGIRQIIFLLKQGAHLAHQSDFFAFCSRGPEGDIFKSCQTRAWIADERQPLQTHDSVARNCSSGCYACLETTGCHFLDPGYRGLVRWCGIVLVKAELDADVTACVIGRTEGKRFALVFHEGQDGKRAAAKLHGLSWNQENENSASSLLGKKIE